MKECCQESLKELFNSCIESFKISTDDDPFGSKSILMYAKDLSIKYGLGHDQISNILAIFPILLISEILDNSLKAKRVTHNHQSEGSSPSCPTN